MKYCDICKFYEKRFNAAKRIYDNWTSLLTRIDFEIELFCFDFGNLPQNFCKLVTLLKAKLTIKRFLYESNVRIWILD